MYINFLSVYIAIKYLWDELQLEICGKTWHTFCNIKGEPTIKEAPMPFTKTDLKKVFSGYRTLSPKMMKKLHVWGFSIKRTSGNHMILAYTLKGKVFCFVASKTGSDRRAGLNLACVIYNTLHAACAA